MGDKQVNLELIRNLYAAFGRGDLAFITNACSEDVDWAYVGPTVIPFGGQYNGRTGVAQFFARLAGSCEMKKFEPRDLISDEDNVIVVGFEEGVARPTARSYQTPWVHVFTLKGGKVARFREFSDSYSIAVAFQGVPSPDGVVH